MCAYVNIFMYKYFILEIWLSVLDVDLFIHLRTYIFICLFIIHLFIYIFIYLFIYLF